MRSRYYDDLTDTGVPGLKYDIDGSPVLGRNVVPSTDGTIYTMYELRINATVILASPRNADATGQGVNHLYYIISGAGNILINGKESGKRR